VSPAPEATVGDLLDAADADDDADAGLRLGPASSLDAG